MMFIQSLIFISLFSFQPTSTPPLTGFSKDTLYASDVIDNVVVTIEEKLSFEWGAP